MTRTSLVSVSQLQFICNESNALSLSIQPKHNNIFFVYCMYMLSTFCAHHWFLSAYVFRSILDLQNLYSICKIDEQSVAIFWFNCCKNALL